MNSVQNPAYHAGMEARFAVASRHSRMVRVLRVAVPAAVILAMAAIIAVSIFNPFRMLLPKLPVDIGNLVVSGSRITMESPHLSGYTPDQRPYEVWAKTATQDVTAPDHVDLKTLRAKVLMADHTTMVTLDAGNNLTTLFASYLIPTAMDVPDVRPVVVESGEGKGPFNARGIGEPPTGPPLAAVASAIRDAAGVRLLELPMTPERVFRALEARRKEKGSGEP